MMIPSCRFHLKLIISIILIILFCANYSFGGHAVVDYYLYAVHNSTPQLYVIPISLDGVFQGTQNLYSSGANGALACDTSHRIMVLTNPYGLYGAQGMRSYQMNSDFSLTQLSENTIYNTHASRIFFTPNDQMILRTTTNGLGEIWIMDSTGVLTNTGNTFTGYGDLRIRPQGDIAIVPDIGTTYMAVYHIDYGTQSLSSTQNLPYKLIRDYGVPNHEIAITPDGSMAIVLGLGNTNPSLFDLKVFQIDSTGIVTPGSSIQVSQRVNDLAISPDGKYVYVSYISGTTSVETFQIDTVNKTLLSTGKKFSIPANPVPPCYQILLSPDGKILVVHYPAQQYTGYFWYLGTALASPDGSLSWAGSAMGYGANYNPMNDMLFLVNDLTGIPSNIWEQFDR